MKKFLAVLLVLAMALSVSAVAFADTAAVKLTASACTQSRFQFDIDGVNVAEGDTIVILAQFPTVKCKDTGADADLYSATVRTAHAGSPKFIDAKGIDNEDGWAKDLGNGWYELTLTATAASNGITCAFFYKTAEGTEVYPADGSVINIVSITAGETVYAFDSATNIEAAVFAGRGLTMTAEATTVAVPSGDVEETEDETEDVTEDVGTEETGVVSVAVVAVAAVIGGAVVLKKREF